jgi:hypothetical protein
MASLTVTLTRITRRRIWPRTLLQIFFFAFIALVSVNHTLAESGAGIPFLSSASLHALCPFGGVVSLYQYATTGTFVQKIHDSSFILMILVAFLAVLFGPVFCGWVCPLGSIQEWVGKLGKKLFKRRYNHFVPRKLDRVLRYARYLMLAWVLYMTAVTGKLIFANIDPYHALFNLWSSELAVGGVIVLAVTLVGALFVERPWCKYACPYGALLGLTNLFRVFKIRRKEEACKNCSLCSRSCPMNLPVNTAKIIRDPQCISCLECTTEAVCPAPSALEFSAGGK